MMGRVALGIDVGTSGIRAALLDASGRVPGLATAKMAEGGANPRDPATWGATLALALGRLDPADLAQVGAVAVDGTSGTLLGLDADNQPVGDALMYNDAVEGAAIPAAIAANAPATSAAHGPSSGLAHALALQDRPGVARLLHQADWVAGLISGRFDVTDESNALKTGYDPVARVWPDWLAGTGLRVGLLPRAVPAGAESGRTRAVFGLPGGEVMVAGCTDGCAAFLATGAADAGAGVTSLGSTLTLKLLSDQPVFAPQMGIYSHRIGEVWLAGGASNTGGAVLASLFSDAEIAELSARIDPGQASGLDYYPLLKPGERFPLADPGLAPRLTPRPGDPVRFLQGLLEGIAAIEALGYRRLTELGAPAVTGIRSVGGGAANPAFTALRATRLPAPLLAAAHEDAAVGVARLALRALA